MKDIIVEFSHAIEVNSDEGSLAESSCECSPESLVGRIYRFEVEGKEKWYAGHVVSYNAVIYIATSMMIFLKGP